MLTEVTSGTGGTVAQLSTELGASVGSRGARDWHRGASNAVVTSFTFTTTLCRGGRVGLNRTQDTIVTGSAVVGSGGNVGIGHTSVGASLAWRTGKLET